MGDASVHDDHLRNIVLQRCDAAFNLRDHAAGNNSGADHSFRFFHVDQRNERSGIILILQQPLNVCHQDEALGVEG